MITVHLRCFGPTRDFFNLFFEPTDFFDGKAGFQGGLQKVFSLRVYADPSFRHKGVDCFPWRYDGLHLVLYGRDSAPERGGEDYGKFGSRGGVAVTA